MELQNNDLVDNPYKEKHIIVFVQHMTDGGAERGDREAAFGSGASGRLPGPGLQMREM